jgi:hypothetical protein
MLDELVPSRDAVLPLQAQVIKGRKAMADLVREHMRAVVEPEMAALRRTIDARDKRIAELEDEIAAAKDFGGGFYGEKVTDAVRAIYIEAARKARI